jgi:hypothetical protein
VFCYTGARAGPSTAEKSSFKKFMVTIANASLLSDLELQREQELAEARAIQIGMLPQGALRTAKRNGAIATRRLGNFSERWILRGAEFRGRILWHGKRTRGVQNSRENSPEEILQQLTEAVVSYSCGRPQQNDRTAAILGYLAK